jgi:hypothetical protein
VCFRELFFLFLFFFLNPSQHACQRPHVKLLEFFFHVMLFLLSIERGYSAPLQLFF